MNVTDQMLFFFCSNQPRALHPLAIKDTNGRKRGKKSLRYILIEKLRSPLKAYGLSMQCITLQTHIRADCKLCVNIHFIHR